MKKARLMLSVLGICAVLATAFAFKANTFSAKVLYLGEKGSGKCDIRAEGVKTDIGTANFAASTTSLATNCPDAFVTTTTNF